MQRLSNHNATTYGTYKSGTIIATSDGTTITFLNNPITIHEFAGVLMLTAMVVTVSFAITTKRREKPSKYSACAKLEMGLRIALVSAWDGSDVSLLFRTI